MEKTLHRHNSEDSTVKTLSRWQLLVSISDVCATKFQIYVETNLTLLWSRITETRHNVDQNPLEVRDAGREMVLSLG